MYFPQIFRTPFYKHLYFPTLFDSFFWNVVSNNAWSNFFLQCFPLLWSTFKYLYLFKSAFLKVQVVRKADFHVSFVCVLMLNFRVFERIGNSLTIHSLGMDLQSHKKVGYVAHLKVAPNLFWSIRRETFRSLTTF